MEKYKFDEIDRLVLISDIHLGEHNAMPEWVENMRTYFETFFVKIIKQLKEEGHTPAVIVAGDFFESRKSLDINVLNTGMDIIEMLSSESPVFMLIGNHDIYADADRKINSLRIFRHIDNVHIIDDMATLSCSAGKKVLMISWIEDSKELTKTINDNKRGKDAIILHAEISGMTYDNNRTITKGVNMSGSYGKIYSGHIHKRQDTQKASYLGSPYEIHSKDACCTRGVYVLNMDEDITETFIENTISPRFVKIRYSEIHQDLDMYDSVIRNNYVTVVVESEYRKKFDLKKFTDAMMEHEPRKLSFIEETAKIDVKTSQGENTIMTNDIHGLFINRLIDMEITDDEKQQLKSMSEYYIKRANEEMSK